MKIAKMVKKKWNRKDLIYSDVYSLVCGDFFLGVGLL